MGRSKSLPLIRFRFSQAAASASSNESAPFVQLILQNLVHGVWHIVDQADAQAARQNAVGPYRFARPLGPRS